MTVTGPRAGWKNRLLAIERPPILTYFIVAIYYNFKENFKVFGKDPLGTNPLGALLYGRKF